MFWPAPMYLPLLVSALLAVAAPWVGRRMPPRAGAWAMTCAAVVAAGTWVTELAILAFTVVGQLPLVAAQGPWSVRVLAAEDPVDREFAVGCAAVVLAMVVSATVASWRRGRALVSAWRECRELAAGGDLAVVDDPVPAAFAVLGLPGRVVVSSGMLRVLDARERSALLAHERAHLRHRHHLFSLILHLAAVVDPLLRPLERAGAFAVERWADEDAGAVVEDRPLVARAIARAALASGRAKRAALAATGGPVPQRVRALLAPPIPRRNGAALAFAALMTACCASLAVTAHDTERLFEAAMHAHATAGHLRPGR
ncbi:M56 family metallopeptidase [Actinacidiphila acidipaludis]|uniref:M56 family metallopeptidase n=1 Tax=Actinacidiphila acidipaludis TaxID=2873382 RepID=A0ABS7Q3S5_9ACTN|nr:M56 family metallopeptidase [Streptomyces acidipaludis]MBY8877095.1 M56 family metallopeptidase [Streptomyces acidipaludis]